MNFSRNNDITLNQMQKVNYLVDKDTAQQYIFMNSYLYKVLFPGMNGIPVINVTILVNMSIHCFQELK